MLQQPLWAKYFKLSKRFSIDLVPETKNSYGSGPWAQVTKYISNAARPILTAYNHIIAKTISIDEVEGVIPHRESFENLVEALHVLSATGKSVSSAFDECEHVVQDYRHSIEILSTFLEVWSPLLSFPIETNRLRRFIETSSTRITVNEAKIEVTCGVFHSTVF